MKLLEIKVENVRGIKDLTLSPKGENIVVWGPNGSGKSALIDAVDFLLSGKVSRLKGEGTKDIILSKHGPHIDSSPSEAKVTAVIQLEKSKKNVIINRSFDNPSRLNIENGTEDVNEELSEIESLSKRGQHVLTRRDILKYINSEGATRAQEIQSLLNISEIENIRKNFVKVNGICDREVKSELKNLESSQSDLCSTAQIKSFTKEELLKVINSNRQILEGEDILELSLNNIKSDLNPLTTTPTGQIVNISIFEKYIENIKDYLSDEIKKKLFNNELLLTKLLTQIHQDESLIELLKQKELIDLGYDLLNDNDFCPLCDTKWENEKLKIYLLDKKNKSKIASKIQNSIDPIVKQIKEHFNNLKSSLNHISLVIKNFDNLSEELKTINLWQSNISDYLALFDNLFSQYIESKYNKEKMLLSFAPDNLLFIDNLSKVVNASSPKSTPEQTAWDTLTKLETYFKTYNRAYTKLQNKMRIKNNSISLLNSFLIARDNVLSKLYDSISGRFVELYRALHGEDEKDFKANLKPDGPSLKFEVEFYGRGIHPPNALHSEGHQDSMGLCLYLALNEKLTFGLINLILLDDVVMSVDATHRKSLCNLLVEYFPKRQFFITTHDKTWSNQLSYESVIKTKNKIEFYNWNIETGPHLNYELNLWERIYTDINKNDIPSASSKLRRGGEEFFSQVCESLRAMVPFKLSNNFDFNELLTASISQLSKLIRKAKKSAQVWGNEELFHQLNEIDSTNSQIFKRIGVEQWAINVNVHFNEWADFNANDFRPVAESFEDLFKVFKCNKCGSLFKIILSGLTQESVKCNCGNVNWNLIQNK